MENKIKFIFEDVKRSDIIEFKKFLELSGCKTEFFCENSQNNTMGSEISDIILAIIGSGTLTAIGSAIGIWIQRHREGKMIIEFDKEKVHIELENCAEKERDKVREWFAKQYSSINKNGGENG